MQPPNHPSLELNGLLDVLAQIAVHGKEAEQAQAALKSLANSPEVGRSEIYFHMHAARREEAACKAAAQSALQAWLGGQELADKLRAMPAPEEAPTSARLLPVIHDALKEMANPAKVRQELEKYYQHQDFAQVKSLFEGEDTKHVDSLACELKLIEQVKKKPERQGQQSDLSTYHERLEWVKNRIALEDLFKRRSTKPDGPEKEIQKVLLVGEPGTGKTTLSRRLASLWAQGKWGKELKAVYVLPVRALQQSQYNNGPNTRTTETLATAIANNCFSPMEEEEYRRFREQINEELEQPTTLVVLDGLDEGAVASKRLLKQAKEEGRHKLLMLSRPYGIETERKLVDIEIEHAGFNDGQMEAYVRDNLSPELGEELLQFIKAYPAIASIAHVPVNLQILCALWKDDGPGVRAETSNGSLPGLYRMLTEYTCNRYEERQRNVKEAVPYTNREELFDKLGQVALKGLEQGEVQISGGLVDKVLGVDAKIKTMLKDSGFLLLEEVGKQYQFPHLTFQEYFAGRALAGQLLSSDNKVRKKGEKFLTKHQYAPQYGRMLSFLSGEVSKEQEIDSLRQLLELVNAGPQEVAGVQHLLLQIRLLNEWLCVAEDDLEEELASLEEEFPVMASLEEWFCEGVDRVRRGDDDSSDDRALLSLLTSGLRGSRAVAAHAPALLEPLLAAAKDEDSSVRSAASEALGQFSLEQFINAYWATQHQALKQGLIPLIATRLYHTPLLVRTSLKRHHQKLFLYPTAAKKPVEWDKPHEEVQCFVKQVKSVGKLQHVEQVLQSLVEDMRNADSLVRLAAGKALGAVVHAAPQRALEVLPRLIEALPEHAPALLEPLLAVSKASASDVRYAAIKALREVLKAAPQQAEQVPEGTFANQASSDGRTPLVIAAEKGHLELAQFLVDKGADVNQATADGRTPLIIAAEHGHEAVVECLQKAGANIETPDKEGKTPLMIAAEHGHLAVVEYLQEAGANIEATDKEGKTPLMIATQKGYSKVVQFLEGAQENQQAL